MINIVAPPALSHIYSRDLSACTGPKSNMLGDSAGVSSSIDFSVQPAACGYTTNSSLVHYFFKSIPFSCTLLRPWLPSVNATEGIIKQRPESGVSPDAEAQHTTFLPATPPSTQSTAVAVWQSVNVTTAVLASPLSTVSTDSSSAAETLINKGCIQPMIPHKHESSASLSLEASADE